MLSRHKKAVFVALAAGLGALFPAAARAQQAQFAPALGFYFPVGGWTQVSDGGTGYAPERRQLPAHMLAARFTVWTSKRFGLEGTFAYTPSQVAVSIENTTTDIKARVFMTSVRALYKVVTLFDGHPERREHWDIFVGAGGGLVHRAGSAWENTSGVTTPAVVFTGGVLAPLTRHIMWRVSLEDFVSWTHYDKGRPSQSRARMHNDLVGSLSVVLPLGGR